MAASFVTRHLLFLLFLLLSVPTIAQTSSNITLGSTLLAKDDVSSSWPSPSGDFAFGFRRLNGTDLFLLSIWFDKIPDKTIVWYANGDNPTQTGSMVTLSASGLVLTGPKGQEIWRTKQVNAGIAYAAMLDTGNFVLAGDNNSGYIWESFNSPTDTILPTQVFGLGDDAILSSHLTRTNFSKGRFELRMTPEGNLVMNPLAWPSRSRYIPYYTSNTKGEGFSLVFNHSGHIYIQKRIGESFNLTPSNIGPVSEFYYRATLDFDGVFMEYAHARTNYFSKGSSQGWFKVWSIPDDICFAISFGVGSGACGYNSYCILNSDGRPKCECPPGYSFKSLDNEVEGCKPNFPLGCGVHDGGRDPEDIYEMEELEHANWPTGDYERFDDYSIDECKRSCLHDCNCAAAIYGIKCWKKKLPLSNGRLSNSQYGKALIKVRKEANVCGNSNPPNSETEKVNQLKLKLLLGGSVLFNFLFLAAVSLVAVLFYKSKLKMSKPCSTVAETNLRSFTYKELEKATDGFEEELGMGSFGIVYKGSLELGSKKFVAVKKLDKVVHEGEKEFRAEVSTIGRTHHKNLVQLVGFCDEEPHKLLVYEFMSNGTLAKFLFGISRPDWNQRTQIAMGVARGLMYLHEECGTQIIHCDIKPQNILLDDSLTARISDFGLAKLLMADQTRTQTGIRGTRGYVAPEWFRNKPVSVKVDVYSYGVMLLEIICCRKSVEINEGEEEKAILTDWAYDCYKEGRLCDLVNDDEEAWNDERRLQRWVMIAIWCIQEEPSLRPTMKKVTQMLEGVADVFEPPCPFSTVGIVENGTDNFLGLQQHNATDNFIPIFHNLDLVM